MANEDRDGAAWHQETSKRVGQAILKRRKELGLTAQQLAERCRELRAPIHRSTITKIENGRPRFDLGELIVLAAALNTSPAVLMYPGPYDEMVDLLPGKRVAEFDAVEWFSARRYYLHWINDGGDDFPEYRNAAKQWSEAVRSLESDRALVATSEKARAAETAAGSRSLEEVVAEFESKIKRYDKVIDRLSAEIDRLDRRGGDSA